MIRKAISVLSRRLNAGWTDPVWSKVIATVICAVAAFILKFCWNLISGASIEEAFASFFSYFGRSTRISNWLFVALLLVITGWILPGLFGIVRKFMAKEKLNPQPPLAHSHSTAFFAERIGKAFPGIRGVEWFDSKSAVVRMKEFFRDPVSFTEALPHCAADPVWVFRGRSAYSIYDFKVLSKTKVLINSMQMEIKRIAVFQSSLAYKSFIYVETLAEKCTGLREISPNEIQSLVDYGTVYEEAYGLLGSELITEEEFQDGAALRKEKLIDTSKAEFRTRYLSDYNFIVSSKGSSYNSREFERETKHLFPEILSGKATPDSLFALLGSFGKLNEMSS